MFRNFCLIIFIWMISGLAHARQSLPLDTGYTEISLVSALDTVAPGERFTVALKMEFEGNWYTYWRNAGDSGEPVKIIWDLPPGISAGPIQWPAPKIKTIGPIVSYALDGEVWLPVEMTVDETVDLGRAFTLNAHAYFLVCDDICIPEDGALSMPMGLGSTKVNPTHAAQIAAALDRLPQPVSARGSAVLEAQKIRFDLINLPKDFERSTLFPNENPIIVHSDPVTQNFADNGIRFTATPGYGWDEGSPEGFDATLVAEDGQAIVVPISTQTQVDIGALRTKAPTPAAASKLGFWGAIFGGFLGGLILNLMPCVFPIISLKTLSLAKMAHGERKAIRRSAWAYTLGVLFSFTIFAGIILALKTAGASVGWGFQLQSPWLVGALSFLLFAIGLNLLGLYEINGRIQNLGAKTVDRSGPFASFLTGILAVIVTTPCTAPFMAGAVGFALTSSAINTLAVFLALGFGFALPFLLVAYIPGLLTRLPKPGLWMETFRQILAFPMFAAAIWLAWVLTIQSGAGGILRLLISLLILVFGLWLLKNSKSFGRVFGGLSILTAIIGLIFALVSLPAGGNISEDSVEGNAASAANFDYKAWSAEAVATARAEGRPVFVDFTAAWCVTCKVNESLVLNTKKTAELFERTNTEFLVADWTNKNDVIAAELQKYGRAGVPLYLVYMPGREDAQVLPQILTHKILETALE